MEKVPYLMLFKELLNIKMEIFIKEIGLREKEMDMENLEVKIKE